MPNITVNLSGILGVKVRCGVRFTPQSAPFSDNGQIVIGAAVTISTDYNGLAQIFLEQGNYKVKVMAPGCPDVYDITVPYGGGPYSLTDLITAGINPSAQLIFVPDATQADWTTYMQGMYELMSAGNPVTPVFPEIGPGGTYNIPIGAKEWTFTLFSGSATFGGRPVTGPFSDSSPNSLLAAIPIVTGSDAVCYLRYGL